MHSKALLFFSLAFGLVSAQDVETSDYPASCSQYCDAVRDASNRCDQQNDDDQAERQCVCDTNNMSSMLPECLACVAPHRNVENYNEGWDDIHDLLMACGFSTTTLSGVPQVTSSIVYTTTVTTTDDDGEIETDTDEVTSFYTGTAAGAASPTQTVVTSTASGGETTVITSSVTPSPTGNSGNSAQSASSSSSPNAAVVTGAPLIGAAAGVMAVMVAL